jgi:iron-sulfur cluster repair protein YtfE (RIC family)
MNEELYKKQLIERFRLIQSNHYALSYPDLIEPEESLLQIIFELLQGNIEYQTNLFQDISLHQLTSYLRYTHAYYCEKKFFELEQTLTLFLKNIDAELFQDALMLLKHYQQFKHELMHHIQEEEETIIPYILWLCKYEEPENIPSPGEFIKANKDISLNSFLLEHNHDELQSFQFQDYVSKQQATFKKHTMYRVFLEQLNYFCNDLRIHSAIEDGIVLPKAVLLEKKILRKMHSVLALN